MKRYRERKKLGEESIQKTRLMKFINRLRTAWIDDEMNEIA